MRRVLAIVICFALLATATGCAKPHDKPKATGLPMKVAQYYWPGQFWKEIAQKKGWFKEAGLNVELVDTNSDYFGFLGQTVAGKIDANSFVLFDLINFNIQGAELVGVIYTDQSFGVDVLVAKKDIPSARDLKGKTIGVTKDTYLAYILSVVLEKNRLSMNDVKLVNILVENAADEFIKGNLDAVIVWEPEVTKAIEKGNGHKLFDTSEINGISPSLEAFRREFIKERPKDVQAYIGVWNKTTRFIKENPEEAFQIIADIYKKPEAEAAWLAKKDKIMDLDENIISFTYASGFESLHGAARRINDFMIDKGATDKRLDSMEFLDNTFIRALERERERVDKR